MGSSFVNKPPFDFKIDLYSIEKNINYLLKYKDVDSKGRYLYWDELKYRVESKDDKKIAWWATKFNRMYIKKDIELKSISKKNFYFCTPNSLQAKIHKIEKLSSNIAPNDSIKKMYLISTLILEESISSSQLEGASTTREVAKELIISKKKPKSIDEIMIINNYKLMKKVKETIDEELSVELILDYHKIATNNTFENGNIAGKFRESNSITVVNRDGETLHQPPEYKDIEKRLNALCDFANKEHNGEDGVFIHPIIKAIILHFMLSYEHPFADGNGRTARALFYYYMLKSGYNYFEYISISKLLKEAPSKYSKSFLYTELDDGDLTYFIYYQTDIILRAIDELYRYLDKKSQEFQEATKLLNRSKITNKLNFIQKDIIKKAIKNPGRIFSAKELVIEYNISANSARKYLRELGSIELLLALKRGKSVDYIAPMDIREKLNNPN